MKIAINSNGLLNSIKEYTSYNKGISLRGLINWSIIWAKNGEFVCYTSDTISSSIYIEDIDKSINIAPQKLQTDYLIDLLKLNTKETEKLTLEFTESQLIATIDGKKYKRALAIFNGNIEKQLATMDLFKKGFTVAPSIKSFYQESHIAEYKFLYKKASEFSLIILDGKSIYCIDNYKLMVVNSPFMEVEAILTVDSKVFKDHILKSIVNQIPLTVLNDLVVSFVDRAGYRYFNSAQLLANSSRVMSTFEFAQGAVKGDFTPYTISRKDMETTIYPAINFISSNSANIKYGISIKDDIFSLICPDIENINVPLTSDVKEPIEVKLKLAPKNNLELSQYSKLVKVGKELNGFIFKEFDGDNNLMLTHILSIEE